jgi:hypothetical protein
LDTVERSFHPMKARIKIAVLIGLWTVCVTAGTKEDFGLFRNGERLVWDSTGHEKAKGIRMKISYPRTWKAEEGSRPNIVQKFTSDSGRGMEMVLVQTKALPKPYNRELSEKEKQEAVSREMAKGFIPNGGRFVSHKVTEIDGEVCAMIEFEVLREQIGLQIGQKMLTFIIPRKGALLMIQCSTGGDASSGFEAINKHYEEVKPLFLLISSSCVLTEKWKTP